MIGIWKLPVCIIIWRNGRDSSKKRFNRFTQTFYCTGNKASEENPLNAEDLFFPDENYIHTLLQADNGGRIDLLPAILYEDDYYREIESFDWPNFYDNQEGYVYLSWFKEQLKKKYDYVLIDSRTGLMTIQGFVMCLCLT